MILSFVPPGNAGLVDFQRPSLQQQLKPCEPSSPALPMLPPGCPGQFHWEVQEQPVFAMYLLQTGGFCPAVLTYVDQTPWLVAHAGMLMPDSSLHAPCAECAKPSQSESASQLAAHAARVAVLALASTAPWALEQSALAYSVYFDASTVSAGAAVVVCWTFAGAWHSPSKSGQQTFPRKVLSHPGKHWHSFIRVMKSKLCLQPKLLQLPDFLCMKLPMSKPAVWPAAEAASFRVLSSKQKFQFMLNCVPSLAGVSFLSSPEQPKFQL
mmetsp:Transcript_74945/g.231761  ORF Transcript_74945/g.231761 Transcript_74945/m.231761 type:complete len:267 (-) Transcript_74945:268-1068(-)